MFAAQVEFSFMNTNVGKSLKRSSSSILQIFAITSQNLQLTATADNITYTVVSLCNVFECVFENVRVES